MKFNDFYTQTRIDEAKIDKIKIPKTYINQIKYNLPDIKLQVKYAPWFEREYKSILGIIGEFNSRMMEEMVGVVLLYEKMLPFIEGEFKDPYRLSYQTLKDVAQKANKKFHEKKISKEAEKGLKAKRDDTIIVFEDEDWLLVFPNTIEGAQYWGMQNDRNAWCTSSRERNQLLNYVVDQNVGFVLAFNKKFHVGPASKFAFMIGNGHPINDYEEVYDFNDSGERSLDTFIEKCIEKDKENEADQIEALKEIVDNQVEFIYNRTMYKFYSFFGEKIKAEVEEDKLRSSSISSYTDFLYEMSEFLDMNKNTDYYKMSVCKILCRIVDRLNSLYEVYTRPDDDEDNPKVKEVNYDSSYINLNRSSHHDLINFWLMLKQVWDKTNEKFKGFKHVLIGYNYVLNDVMGSEMYFMAADDEFFQPIEDMDETKAYKWNKELIKTLKGFGIRSANTVDVLKTHFYEHHKLNDEEEKVNKEIHELINMLES